MRKFFDVLLSPFDPKEKIRPSFVFAPQDDITAYELAKLIPLITPASWRTYDMLMMQVGALPENVSRHLKETTETYF